MQLSDKLTKPLTEVKYLNADNVSRYRCIMRIFFENYERLKYWLYQDEVYTEMLKNPLWQDYKPEQCQQDLTMLTEWKNLNTIQDTRNITSIEEFKNKKYRYQMSEYSVEIERLVIRLENLLIEGSSLEPTLLERIKTNVTRFQEIIEKDSSEIYTWWTDLNNDFVRLNQNYQDYIRDLNSVKAEEMMRTKEFLVFKDRLIEYLRSFIKGLQRNVGVIEECLRSQSKSDLEQLFKKIVEYELLIPRIDAEISQEIVEQKIYGRYQSIYDWFVGSDGQENEAAKLFDATNEIIRRITRYAAQISERNALGANRKEEYKKISELFMKCNDVKEAHKMAAMVFGLEKPLHISSNNVRETDSINKGVYEENPFCIELKPRIRNYHEKVKRSSIQESKEKKLEIRNKMLQQQKEEMQKLKMLEKDGMIDFSSLPVLEPRIREILLKWISDAMESVDFCARTDDGRTYSLDRSCINERCVVNCIDGKFTMPKIKIVFQETNV
ncbi:MAG: TIGR02677 family protein [Lachnospiraceae bacterium]|nr:TIGR02677 family protein [Lachnospiraceae bacterium]